MRRSLTEVVSPLAALLALSACSGPGAGSAPILGTRAPASATFATVRTVEVPLAELLPPEADARVHLRLTLDVEGQRVVFLGRVGSPTAAPLRLSIPRISSRLYYEIYGAAGPIARGEWKAPPEQLL